MRRLISLVAVTILVFSCNKLELLEHSNPLDDGQIFVTGQPTVVTMPASNITYSAVLLEGDITVLGDAAITQHGHCWSTTASPTVGDNKTTLGTSGLGSFSSNVTQLNQNTEYFFRAYSINSFNTVYGVELSFTTEFAPCSITSVSTTTDYTLVCPTQTIFSNGDSYTIGFDGVVIGQVESVELFLDETFIHSFGNWVTFYPDGERSFILPTNIQSSNCYTIRIILNGLYISNPFTIY